jgi:hypothetical protein
MTDVEYRPPARSGRLVNYILTAIFLIMCAAIISIVTLEFVRPPEGSHVVGVDPSIQGPAQPVPSPQ